MRTEALRAATAQMLDAHWRAPGYCVPNAAVYPWLFLWDSCLHSVVWDALGSDRAVVELRTVLDGATPSGFLPHLRFLRPSEAAFWGQRSTSTITQPPLHGHALAVLAARGHDVGDLVAPAVRATRHLLEQRRAPCGLLRIYHPWESGVDDHPRWAAWQPDPWDRSGWYRTKGELVAALRVVDGEAVGSSRFDVCPAGFNALVAFDARRLGHLTGDGELLAAADALADALDQAWNGVTWLDLAPDGTPGSGVATVDALLPALVTADAARAEAALVSTVDPDGFGLPYGPAGVHPGESAHVPDAYGRGSTWPHLTYLLWWAAAERGLDRVADALAARLVAGAAVSDLAEHWDPRDGRGLGAAPQSWTGLALAVGAGAAAAAGARTVSTAGAPVGSAPGSIVGEPEVGPGRVAGQDR